ncbi:hypothetical protein PTKIN_Ptkin09bG0166000 [Pterospermum kingtungense]
MREDGSKLTVFSGLRCEAELKPWKNLFTKHEQFLRFSPPSLRNGKALITPPKDLFECGVEKWKDYVVAQFIARDNVLEGGPWHFQNQHLVNGLRLISNALGNPLYMDRIIVNQERIAYAKICVEIEVMKEISETIDVLIDKGNIVTVTVQVSWVSQHCSHCKLFRHSDVACSKKPYVKTTRVWRPKHVEKEMLVKVSTPKPVSSFPKAKAGSLNTFDILSKAAEEDSYTSIATSNG